ncbi:MAG: hypothetical protein KDC47_09950 [Flavobacteriaceae bacterium]|nr:hypothetical protein [Flavobacteriaceae bacterium]
MASQLIKINGKRLIGLGMICGDIMENNRQGCLTECAMMQSRINDVKMLLNLTYESLLNSMIADPFLDCDFNNPDKEFFCVINGKSGMFVSKSEMILILNNKICENEKAYSIDVIDVNKKEFKNIVVTDFILE